MGGPAPEEFCVQLYGKYGTVKKAVAVDSEGRILTTPFEGYPGGATPSCSAVVVGAVTTIVLAANVNRVAYVLVNDSNETIYLGFGTAAVLNSGYRLNVAGGLIIDDLFSGQINAICTTGGKNLTVTEYV